MNTVPFYCCWLYWYAKDAARLSSHSKNKGVTHIPARLWYRGSTKGLRKVSARPLCGIGDIKVGLGPKFHMAQDKCSSVFFLFLRTC